jgi:hypothetical protein
MSIKEKVNFSIMGHAKIVGKQTGEVLREKCNAIHPQHMAMIFGHGLANENYSYIYSLAFGNGGTYTDSTNRIIYNTPNTAGLSAGLYNQTYSEVVATGVTGNNDGNTVISSPSNVDLTTLVTITCTIAANEPNPSLYTPQYSSDSQDANSLTNIAIASGGTVSTGPNAASSTLPNVVNPADQYPQDSPYYTNTNFGYAFNFDEMALMTLNPLYVQPSTANGNVIVQPQYLLLSHLIFDPIQKTSNRELIVTYTLSISVS